MSRLGFAVRFVGVVLMAVWVGGLASYGAMILPALHARFTPAGTAPITRHFTGGLNGVGLATLLAWGLGLFLNPSNGPTRTRRVSWVLLAASALLLVVEFALHGALSRQMTLHQTRSEGFYPLHRVYLIVSTVQWLANLALLGLALPSGPARPGPDALPADGH
jgi:hypothetical protein